jgi:hypothetical protein
MPIKKSYAHAAYQQTRKDKRKQEAAARQRAHDLLTLEQKIELAKSRGGSKRELARLTAPPKPKTETPTQTVVVVKEAKPATPPKQKYKTSKRNQAFNESLKIREA